MFRDDKKPITQRSLRTVIGSPIERFTRRIRLTQAIG
jgi:hypothetical protein